MPCAPGTRGPAGAGGAPGGAAPPLSLSPVSCWSRSPSRQEEQEPGGSVPGSSGSLSHGAGHRRSRAGFRPWQGGVRSRPFGRTQQRRGGASAIPPQPSRSHLGHMTHFPPAPGCARCYFGSDSEALLHKFLLQPAPPSASSPPSPPRLQSHSPGDRGERRNLINLQNARDLLIYYYNCSSAHDTSPALGVGTEQLLASAPDRLQALMTFRCLQTVILSSE